jgi:hypothetical protein
MGTANTASTPVLTLMCGSAWRRTRRSSGGTSRLHIKRRFSTGGRIDSSWEGRRWGVSRRIAVIYLGGRQSFAQLLATVIAYCISNQLLFPHQHRVRALRQSGKVDICAHDSGLRSPYPLAH